ENTYWTAGGIMWKSREWAGPGLGYLEMERLTR
ncbi:MAG: YjbF family lipoprotein, partial [Rubellimicrobium sp.]|nr:YjbF family lipoprotein [Rubellimicrobium sp.]MCC5976411.1 YjbF family lipoprotein [Rubellimicrobium sp.]